MALHVVAFYTAELLDPAARTKLTIGIRLSAPAVMLEPLFDLANSTIFISATVRSMQWVQHHIGLRQLVPREYKIVHVPRDAQRLCVTRIVPRVNREPLVFSQGQIDVGDALTVKLPTPGQQWRQPVMLPQDRHGVGHGQQQLMSVLAAKGTPPAVVTARHVWEVLNEVASGMLPGTIGLLFFQSFAKLHTIMAALDAVIELGDVVPALPDRLKLLRDGRSGAGQPSVESVIGDAQSAAAQGKVVLIMSAYG